MSTKGWGESKPVVSNTKPDGSDDPEGRQKNRRVEIVITKQS
jgi:outer membrane protein OmpA-like peptidoglycan-associated protein